MSARELNSTAPDPVAVYREQLAYYAHCLATGRTDELKDAIEGHDALNRLCHFVDGNVGKRVDWLLSMVEFVAPVFENLEQLVQDYAMEWPAAAVGENRDDADVFLEWLAATHELTDVQRDYVACARARNAVDASAMQNRMGHLRFQEMVSLAEEFAAKLLTDSEAETSLMIHLNPIRVWTEFRTGELLGEKIDKPVEVLFFGDGEGVNTAALSPDAIALVRELEERSPWTLDTWATVNGSVNRRELAELCQSLAKMGLIALS